MNDPTETAMAIGVRLAVTISIFWILAELLAPTVGAFLQTARVLSP